MVHREINDIELPYYVWKTVKPIKTVKPNLALDTETLKTGQCFLISDSNGLKADSLNNFGLKTDDALEGLLTFLNNRNYRESVNWFYNLGFDTNAILAYLPFEERKLIANYNQVDYKGFRINILPGKELQISRLDKNKNPKNPTFFYDLAQFYDFVPLKKLAQQTNYKKVYVEDISNVDIKKYQSNSEYKELWQDRCIIDCKITVELADKLTTKINPIVNIHKYKSKASIARRYVLENLKHNLKMPNTHVLDAALKAFHAGHIETCVLGSIKNVKYYDINSAYPHQIADLYETSEGYLHNTEYEPDTAYSFYLVEVDYQDTNLSPLWHTVKDNNYHVTGKCETWITQTEYEFYHNNGYPIKIIKAYHIKKTRYTEKPFEFLVKDLYDLRMEAKKDGDDIQAVYKIILNSIYGVTVNANLKKEISEFETDLYENIGGYLIYYLEKYMAGNMYNPVYGTTITANTRMKLFSDFKSKMDKVLSVNTDGVYLSSKAHVNVSEGLGAYSFESIPEIMIMGSGRYFIKNKNGVVDDKKSRFRSIPKKTSEIHEDMLQRPNEAYLNTTKEKPIKLKESTRVKEYRDKLNVFRRVAKKVSFKTDRRYWFDEVQNMGALQDNIFESRPYNINEIEASC